MIWVYRGYNASGGDLTPSLAGSIVDRVYIPMLIDGKAVDVLWTVWYKPNVERGERGYIAFA